MMRWLLLANLMLAGCHSETPRSGTTQITEAAKVVAETDAQRLTRFNTRRTATTPSDLPAPWRRLLKTLDARALKVGHKMWSYQTDWRGGRHISLKLRLFGLDTPVAERAHAALAKLGLPQLSEPLQEQRIEAGLISWSLSIDRVVAPEGAQRETQLDLSWTRQPKPRKKEPGACRKPHPVPAPDLIPRWLNKTTEKRSTRRRIISELKTTTKRVKARMQMLYHNGFAHDENVGQLTEAAKRAGLVHTRGSGPKQVWTHTDGRRMSLRPVREVHDMGCTIRGPVLEIKWRGPKETGSKR